MPPESNNLDAIEQLAGDSLVLSKKNGEEQKELLETVIGQNIKTKKDVEEVNQVAQDTLVTSAQTLKEAKKTNETLQKQGQKVVIKGTAPVVIKGAKGDKGEQGDKGKDGADGKDGKNGKDGKDGYTPIKGEDYRDGIDGKDGINGKDGYTPIKGIDYQDGIDGRDGLQGLQGPAGKDGLNGTEIAPSEIVEKLSSLKGKERLSMNDLKDVPDFDIARRLASKTVSLVELDDVVLTGLTQDAQGRYILGSGGGGGAVDSVNGQTGVVVLSTADVADSLNSRYVTDAQLVVIGNTSGTNTGDQTSVSGNAGTATALQNARTIGGVSFDGTANITVASATGGFTVSGGNLALGTNSITMSGSIGVTGTRVTKGWFTDLEVTNTITGGVTGNAGTATALLNARTIGGVSFNGTANITVASATGGFTVSGGDLALGANNLTSTGSIGSTGSRILKGWFTDLEVTNAIAGSITGNAATVTGVTLASGSLTLAGADALTLTTSAATNVTLPTTGTLATLAGTEEFDNKTLDSSVGKGTWTASGTWTLPAITLGGNATLSENVSLVLDAALSADGTYCGITEAGTAGAALAFGDLVYLAAADSRWELTDADAEATAGPVKIGICVLAAAGDGSATTILRYGKVRADSNFPAMTIGAPLYISTTPGDIQVAQPSGTDDVIRIVGYANTADELCFEPSNDWLTHV